MTVLAADLSLGVRHRPPPTALDTHGHAYPAPLEPVQGPWPGRAREVTPDRWLLALDPAAWPLDAQETVVEPDTGRTWLVTEARLLTNTLDPSVDYVRVEAHAHPQGYTEP